MNQADNLNNGTFVEQANLDNSPQSESASCPFYSVLPNNDTVRTNLPLLMPASEKPQETQPDAAVSPVSHLLAPPPPQEWVAEPDSEKQALIDAEFKKLLALNEELRSANTNLYEQVETLKGDLSEREKALQWQKKRSNVTESMLKQQVEELATAQEQIKSLFQQLETAVQNVQRQESLIESYKGQLEISLQRLAQLERECAKVQTSYNEQSHQVLQSETACRELRNRLTRQQRQTLQFKAALEKCLENPVPSYDSLDDSVNKFNDIDSTQPRYSKQAQSSFSNAEPIKPWSSQSESLTDELNYPWGESLLSPPHTTKHPSGNSPFTWEFSASDTPNKSPVDDESKETLDEQITSAAPELSSIDEQLEHVIQMFFTAQAPAKKDTEQNQPVWEVTPLDSPLHVYATSDDEELSTTQNAFLDDEYSVSSTLPLCETTVEEHPDYWSEVTQTNSAPLQDISTEPFDDYTNSTDSNSPSPVIYPQRPPKGRKSLASVELPNFRPNPQ